MVRCSNGLKLKLVHSWTGVYTFDMCRIRAVHNLKSSPQDDSHIPCSFKLPGLGTCTMVS